MLHLSASIDTDAKEFANDSTGVHFTAVGNPSNYILSNDPTEWNVSDIISPINATVLPDCIVQELALDVLMYRCLCSYIAPYYSLNASQTCSDTCNIDNKTTPACV